MSLKNQSDHQKLLSIREAVSFSGYTSDYLNRLCKRGVIRAQKVDAHWMLEQQSLAEFIQAAFEKREARSHKLSEERKREYGTTLRTEAIAASVAITSLDPWNTREEKTHALRLAAAGVLFTLLLAVIPHITIPVKNSAALVTEADVFDMQELIDSVAVRWYRFVSGNALRLAGLFMGEDTHVTVHTHSSTHTTASEKGGRTVRPQTGGAVVVPVSPNDDIATIRSNIKDSFSDEVIVTPVDESSGIITPVFRTRSEDQYLYVMVPMPPPEQ